MPLELVEDLNRWEAALGPGQHPDNPLAWTSNSRAHDEQEAGALKQRLQQLNFHQIFLPRRNGGGRQNWLQMWLQVALATRRNINVMPAVMYSIGPAMVLELSGSEAQQNAAFADIAEGRQYCFGLSEPGAGTELTKLSTRAQATKTGWQLDGLKSPLGWSPASDKAIVLASTGEGGPASLSFFLVPLNNPNVSITQLRGRGMASQSFAALVFEGLTIEGDALVGEPGRAFELTLNIQQLVKYMSTAANIGGCHNLLRDVTHFAQSERHGRRLSEYEEVRAQLACATAGLLAAEASAMVAGCLIGATKSQFSIASSVAKHTALETSDRLIRKLRDILSVNYALECDPIFQRFHKVADDLAMVRFIDTNPTANLKNIATQLLEIQRQYRKLDTQKAATQLRDVLNALDLRAQYKRPETLNLAVTNARGDWVLNALFALAKTEKIGAPIGTLATALIRQVDALWSRLDDVDRKHFAKSAEAIALAREYCRIHSAAATLLLWHANKDLATEFAPFTSLISILTTPELIDGPASEALFTWLDQRHEAELAISLVPVKLCERQ